MRTTVITFGLSVLAFSSLLHAQKFFKDDPIWEDADTLPIAAPRPVELSQITDFLQNTFLYRPEGIIPAAENVNTLGEVPDSSWFTNRIGRHPTTIEELVEGPNRVEGPDLSAPWEILSVKEEGITPGLRIRDARGDTYFIKFDPYDYPQLATSTEVICTKFFHAFGYNVPENYLVFLDPTDFRIAPDATIEDHDRPRPLTRKDIEYLLRRVRKRPDGTVQVVASRLLSGKALGPFTYFGTRSDDPNDIFPHENRRELRGLRLFAAWLNHDDARSINTLDMYVPDGEKGYIRHYLVDFGSCLGSGSTIPQNPRAGNEYILEGGPTARAGLTLGIWDRPWRKVPYPDYPAVGNFEAEFFDPSEWRPEYPNPAFERMLVADTFWAVKIIQRFTDDMVRAIVRTGQLEDPEAEAYLVETLIKRRDKIVRHYLPQVNPLDRFQLDKASKHLSFENPGMPAGLSEEAVYEYQWFHFDHETGTLRSLGPAKQTAKSSIPLPDGPHSYLMVRIKTMATGLPRWAEDVMVYVLSNDRSSVVVGIERADEAQHRP